MKHIKKNIIFMTIIVSFIMVVSFGVCIKDVQGQEPGLKSSFLVYSKKVAKVVFMKDSEIDKNFHDGFVIGDSLTKRLEAYGILSKKHCYGIVGQNVGSSKKDFNAIKNKEPKIIFMEYGLNDLGVVNEKSELFYSNYLKQIKYIKKELPDAKIYIISIPPVDESIEDTSPYRSLFDFNESLKELCQKENLQLIDVSSILDLLEKTHDSDGVHPSSRFYSLWARKMILEASL